MVGGLTYRSLVDRQAREPALAAQGRAIAGQSGMYVPSIHDVIGSIVSGVLHYVPRYPAKLLSFPSRRSTREASLISSG
jgi:hypothetical protein